MKLLRIFDLGFRWEILKSCVGIMTGNLEWELRWEILSGNYDEKFLVGITMRNPTCVAGSPHRGAQLPASRWSKFYLINIIIVIIINILSLRLSWWPSSSSSSWCRAGMLGGCGIPVGSITAPATHSPQKTNRRHHHRHHHSHRNHHHHHHHHHINQHLPHINQNCPNIVIYVTPISS